jgi:hypothetical protein
MQLTTLECTSSLLMLSIYAIVEVWAIVNIVMVMGDNACHADDFFVWNCTNVSRVLIGAN